MVMSSICAGRTACLETEGDPDVDPLSPEVRRAELERRLGWSGRRCGRVAGDRGPAGGIDAPTDLLRGADHVVRVEEGVAYENRRPRGDLIADVEPKLGYHREHAARLAADVGRLREVPAEKRLRRAEVVEVVGHQLAVDIDGLDHGAHGELHGAPHEPSSTVEPPPYAELGTVEVVRRLELVLRVEDIGRLRGNVGAAGRERIVLVQPAIPEPAEQVHVPRTRGEQLHGAVQFRAEEVGAELLRGAPREEAG